MDEVIKPQDLNSGGPPVRGWLKDPKTSVVRKGSRLNEMVVVKLDPADLMTTLACGRLTESSRILSFVPTPDALSLPGARQRRVKKCLKCVCHNSEFYPGKARK